ncbi:MAG: NfeD family protein [Bacteroidales bacterium]|nr:NfeD family protein [Bacteroidales bacterium]MDD3430683.1 NfeD family protein [Bacteroidales bacterium]MDD4361361.1 NfeD family protein [Bacteroidales bacterium]MDD4429987.1 NfeD family protein [Bacteroidales bacterium]
MKARLILLLSFLLLVQLCLPAKAADSLVVRKLVYQVDLRDDVNSFTWTQIQKGFAQAEAEGADLILLNMNTYGGEVLYADSIRTRILNTEIPVCVFIDNNAASAGALISIACDRIFMRTGATIGASTVVDQSGEVAPDKFQSYMRGIIRATAESQGRDTLIADGDTTYSWKRDPRIAEAMVDPDVEIPGVIEKGKVLTFTASEALQNKYCDAIVQNKEEILLKQYGYSDYELKVFQLSVKDKIAGRLMGTALRAILIMIIVAGIWFELQSPGIGFPSIAAGVAAILYFAPLYLDGLVQYWEIILFVAGVILIFLEIFVIPGFGIAGILGILAVVLGLSFALIDNTGLSFDFRGLEMLDEALVLVILSMLIAFIISLWLTSRIGIGKGMFKHLALESVQEKEAGYVAVPAIDKSIIGKTGLADTDLRPSGKVRIGDVLYDAVAEVGYVEKGKNIKVNRLENAQLYVEELK